MWKSPNGDINDVQSKGWITADELVGETADFAVKESEHYVVCKIGNSEIVKKRGDK